MKKLTVEQIESIEFMPIGMGEYPYRLQRMIVNHPEQNVAGLILIGSNYYKRIYDMRTQPPPRRASSFLIDRLFGF